MERRSDLTIQCQAVLEDTEDRGSAIRRNIRNSILADAVQHSGRVKIYVYTAVRTSCGTNLLVVKALRY